MILELLDIIEKRDRISLSELSALSRLREEVVEHIMEQLIRKNKAKKIIIECHTCMKDCSSCIKRGNLIIYDSV